MNIELIASCNFGLEAVVKREIAQLGYKVVKTEDCRVFFQGDNRAIVRSNLWLRTADKVLLNMGDFEAVTFEELFQQTKALPWEQLIPPDGNFPVTGSSIRSVLKSVPSCQSIIKKAIVERLKEAYMMDTFPEDGPVYKIEFMIMKDKVTIAVNTSGEGLHKRGYRKAQGPAPIKETLAAAMVLLSYWKDDRILLDPCCGSGTIPIEAALIGRNIPPGINRSFVSQDWDLIDGSVWKEEKARAFKAMNVKNPLRIYGYDIDKKVLACAMVNAEEAGVSDDIVFRCKDATTLTSKTKNGIIITNPPYGTRIGSEKSIKKLYDGMKRFFAENPTWSLFMITPDEGVEEAIFQHPADRRRKLYNGRMKVCYYQFHGKKDTDEAQ